MVSNISEDNLYWLQLAADLFASLRANRTPPWPRLSQLPDDWSFSTFRRSIPEMNALKILPKNAWEAHFLALWWHQEDNAIPRRIEQGKLDFIHVSASTANAWGIVLGLNIELDYELDGQVAFEPNLSNDNLDAVANHSPHAAATDLPASAEDDLFAGVEDDVFAEIGDYLPLSIRYNLPVATDPLAASGGDVATVATNAPGASLYPSVPHRVTTTPERWPPLTPAEVAALPPQYSTYVAAGLIINGCWSRAGLTNWRPPAGVPCAFGASFYGNCTTVFDSYMSSHLHFPEKLARDTKRMKWIPRCPCITDIKNTRSSTYCLFAAEGYECSMARVQAHRLEALKADTIVHEFLGQGVTCEDCGRRFAGPYDAAYHFSEAAREANARDSAHSTYCDRGVSSLSERIASTLFVRAPQASKVTLNVRPGRYIIKFSDLRDQSIPKQPVLLSNMQGLPNLAFLERHSGQYPTDSYPGQILNNRHIIRLVQENLGISMDAVVFRWTETPSAIFPIVAYGPLVAKPWIEGARSQLLVAIRETAILIDYIKAGATKTVITIANGFTCCLFLFALFAEVLRDHVFAIYIVLPPNIMQKAVGRDVLSVRQWQHACEQRGRILFRNEDDGFCISTQSSEWVALGLESSSMGIFEQGLVNIMDHLQQYADDSVAGARSGKRTTEPTSRDIQKEAIEVVQAMMRTR